MKKKRKIVGPGLQTFPIKVVVKIFGFLSHFNAVRDSGHEKNHLYC